VAPPKTELQSNYGGALEELKDLIQETRLRTVISANAAMIQLYWDIGQRIRERQAREGWGAKVIERLSTDLREAFLDMSGLSSRNLRYMRDFAAAWPKREIWQRLLPNLPWGQNLALLDKLHDADTRLSYARQCAKHGWSRSILELQIGRRIHERQGKAQNSLPTSPELATSAAGARRSFS
jgi:predicted nuclease of restriction endonuclease-like (RecB) superfamily